MKRISEFGFRISGVSFPAARLAAVWRLPELRIAADTCDRPQVTRNPMFRIRALRRPR